MGFASRNVSEARQYGRRSATKGKNAASDLWPSPCAARDSRCLRLWAARRSAYVNDVSRTGHFVIGATPAADITVCPRAAPLSRLCDKQKFYIKQSLNTYPQAYCCNCRQRLYICRVCGRYGRFAYALDLHWVSSFCLAVSQDWHRPCTVPHVSRDCVRCHNLSTWPTSV